MATSSHKGQLPAQYRRLKPRLGQNKALGAVKYSVIVACWQMLTTGELYRDPGGDYFQRATPRLVKHLEPLGHTITLQEAAAA